MPELQTTPAPVSRAAAPALDLSRPVFIVGSGSSGTTLLGVMLDRHSQFACGPELYALNKRQVYGPWRHVRARFAEWLEAGLLSNGQVDVEDFFHSRGAYFCDGGRLAEWARQADSLRDFFDTFCTNYLTQRSKARWVEKTGSNGYYLRHILKLYPRARIVHMVRDGRDAVCSLLGRDPRPYHCVSHWLYNVAAALAWRGHPAYIEIKYEDLATTPEPTLQRLCAHLEVEFEPAMLERSKDDYWKTQAANAIHGSWKANPLSGGVSAASVGRYKTDLAPDVLALFWRMRLSPWGKRRLRAKLATVADLMPALGYADGPPPDLGPVPHGLCRQGIRRFLRRARRNWHLNSGLWWPLTYVPPW